MEQQTLAQAFALEGIGIHTGAVGRVTVRPAEADTGRVFQTNGVTIPALAEWVVDTQRCTTLGREDARLMTVEHLLSALFAFGIDNALIETEGPEVPILDGSAKVWCEAIRDAGIMGQQKQAHRLHAQTPFEQSLGASTLLVSPADHLQLSVMTEFTHWPQGTATVTFDEDADMAQTAATYVERIAPARTFAFRHEVDALLASGLAQGGSLDNALVITPPDEFSTPLRVPREWAMHKLLDVLGDLALVGERLSLRLKVVRPGHRANVALALALRRERQTHAHTIEQSEESL